LAQAQRWKQAQKVWTEAEYSVQSIEHARVRSDQLLYLGEALIQAQHWEEAERIIRSIEHNDPRTGSDLRAKGLRALGSALAAANRHGLLLRLVQGLWQQADRQDYAIQILSLAYDFISLPTKCATRS